MLQVLILQRTRWALPCDAGIPTEFVEIPVVVSKRVFVRPSFQAFAKPRIQQFVAAWLGFVLASAQRCFEHLLRSLSFHGLFVQSFGNEHDTLLDNLRDDLNVDLGVDLLPNHVTLNQYLLERCGTAWHGNPSPGAD